MMTPGTAILHFLVSIGQLPLVTQIATAYTALGSFYLLPVYTLGLYASGRPARSYQYLLGGIGTGLLVYLLKQLIARPRPSIAIIQAPGFAFPSGHAAMAFITATMLTAPRSQGRRWALGLASLIALTRLLLGVHYPLDIIAGGLIGYSVGTIIQTNTHRLPAALQEQ